MILGVVFLVGSLVIYFQFIQPAYEETLKLKGEKVSLQSFLENEKKAVDKVKELINAYNTKNEKIQQIVSLVLPTKPDAAGAVAQLYGLSQNNYLQFKAVSISVSGLSNTSLPVEELAPSNLKSALKRPIGTLSLSTALSGSYDDFKMFLSQLQTNIRIFDLKSLTITPIVKLDKNKNSREIEKYNFGITVSTYYQNP